jgi:GNAT superfamily N-acetyltransferase
VPEQTTTSTWRRILDPDSPINALIADADDERVGFANYILHEFTWSDRPTCLLEDLFVSPDARGLGIGARLIEALVEHGRAEGWARVYWHTRGENTTARRLYDRFCPADGFIRYTIPLAGPTAR